MTSGGKLLLPLLVAVVVLAAMAAGEEVLSAADASSCNAKQLSSCVPALTTGVSPTAACCSGMKAQQGCLCQFAKNPAYARYTGPNARRAIAACGISLPHCS